MSVSGNSRRENFRFGVRQKLVEASEGGKKDVDSQALCPLKQNLISLQLIVDCSQECLMCKVAISKVASEAALAGTV